jgi:hypothetical protein
MKVFLSHSTKDKQFVQTLAAELKAEKIEPWLCERCRSWIRKLQARFVAGGYASAVDAAARARRLLWTSAAMFETAEYHFYGALSSG